MKKFPILLLLTGLLAAAMACHQQPPKSEEATFSQADQEKYLATGQQIASATFATLSGRLQAAMQAGGVPNAIEYCSLAAYPLVDSLSAVHGATIRRTSLEVRNPLDAPTESEQLMLAEYEKNDVAGQELKPIVRELDGGRVAFYAPIRVNALCLQCHGVLGETLTAENYDFIKKAYPEDKAIGYADGDLRGMWSITFEK